MTTITKERLLTIKQWRETYGPGSNVVLPAEEAEELARIALASLEAEPIGFRCRRNDNLGDWSYVYHREPDDFERKHLVIEGIYAAPPAPVVPEEMYWQDAPVEGSSKAAAYATGWNDCREAMLQSGNFRENKDSSTNNFRKIPEASTSSPVTPDGWISCSDRMPNDKQYVWCWGKSYGWTECDTFEGYYDWSRNKWWAVTDNGEEPASKVTHWMPLPEPPQEVNRG
ncbi:DUF551 domain-containing protein [Escherichia coli]|uniref:DUF551 domain-containing protein n=1 Tax=Escherichia coli TaxID=562 RepID=UPI000539934C|nr:DUF551 domain-containing protein [Escherichia coli]EEZ1080705.1 DUF551 domain-containing protein [Escherichia coli]EGT7545453.1 DUF551 domain-containing protein [Escherichia coli]HCQ4291607.1 DUF551 domain-containing protein [Escherichia coli]